MVLMVVAARFTPLPLRRAILADCPPLASLIPFSERDGITWHYSNPCGLHCGDACLAAGHSLPGTEWNGMEWNGMESSRVEWNGMEWTEWSDIVGSPSGYPVRRDALTPWARLQWPPLDLSRPKVLVHTGTVPLRIGTPHRCRGSLYVEGSSYVRGIPIRVRTVLIRARTPYADEDSLYV